MFEILFLIWIAFLVLTGNGSKKRAGERTALPWLMSRKERDEIEQKKQKEEEREFRKMMKDIK